MLTTFSWSKKAESVVNNLINHHETLLQSISLINIDNNYIESEEE